MLPPMKRRHLLLPALAASLSLAGPAWAQGLRERLAQRREMGREAQPGDFEWTDAERQRAVPLRLRLPAGEAPCPLVLFSHGLGGDLNAGSLWSEAWAAAGIATLHLQHPGSDRSVLRSGPRALRTAANAQQLQARALDVRFVLDELARRAAEHPRLRLDRIGLAGHSFGAHTTLAVAGQHFPRGATLADPRPRAFAAFSPSPPNGGDATAAFGSLRRPVLCLTGSLDGSPLVPEGDANRREGAWRRAVYDALPAGDKAELWLDGADHMSFGGQAVGGAMARLRERDPRASAQAERHQALIAAVSSDWWRAQLLDDAAARARLSQTPAHLKEADAWRRG